jgi:hypothetical protein
MKSRDTTLLTSRTMRLAGTTETGRKSRTGPSCLLTSGRRGSSTEKRRQPRPRSLQTSMLPYSAGSPPRRPRATSPPPCPSVLSSQPCAPSVLSPRVTYSTPDSTTPSHTPSGASWPQSLLPCRKHRRPQVRRRRSLWRASASQGCSWSNCSRLHMSSMRSSPAGPSSPSTHC